MTTHTNDTADLTFQRRDLRRALIACSSDTARVNLAQILVEPDGTVVATDGHRLHVLADTMTDTISDDLPDAAITIPARVLRALLDATKGSAAHSILRVRIDSDGRAHADTLDGLALSERCGEATFPPYRTILDGLTCTEKYNGTAREIRAAIKSGMGRRESGETNAGTDVIAMTADGPVGPVGCPADAPCCNARYLLEALTGLSKDTNVEIRWSGSLEPVEVRASGNRAIVMPVRM